MIRCTIAKPLPQTLLRALAILALAVLGLASGAPRAGAQSLPPRFYMIDVTFDTITFSNIDDGLGDSEAEVYGIISATTSRAGPKHNEDFDAGRLIGGYPDLSVGDCTTTWGNPTLPTCAKDLTDGTYRFADTPMCEAVVPVLCSGDYRRQNNTFRLKVFPGDAIYLEVALHDWDPFGDDDVCVKLVSTGPLPRAQLDSLDHTITLKQSNGHATCQVTVLLRRVKPAPTLATPEDEAVELM